MNTEQQKKVGIWIRVSTDMQVQGDSPEHHERRARSYADFKGWKVAKVYLLEAKSGKSVLDYPETKQMLADLASGLISGLIFSKLARLARNTKELLELSDLFRDEGADLVSIQEQFDTSTPAGRLFYTIIAAMAEWEREEISARVAASVPIRAEMGKPLGGAAPFGYQWLEKRLQIDPDEAPIRRLMFELFLKEKRFGTVGRRLNEQGYRTRRGGKWTSPSVQRLLTDPIAKGLRRANYTKSTGDGKHWVVKPESEWVYVQVPAIVPVELWDEVNQIIAHQKSQIKPVSRKPRHLFAGLIRCHCGEKMYVLSNSPKYTCTKCRNKIGATVLESIFKSQLEGFLVSPDQIEAQRTSLKTLTDEKAHQLDVLGSQARKLKQKLDTLVGLVSDGTLSKEQFQGHYNEPHTQYEQTMAQMEVLRNDLEAFSPALLPDHRVVDDAQDLMAAWSAFEPEAKKSIIQSMTESILIGTDSIDLNLYALPRLTSKVTPVAKATHNLRDLNWPPT